jgi:pimeloyl-ACP methyl ester carboxylesterase
MIPAIDFGGLGATLHFSHANGYPPRAYTPLLEALSGHYHTIAMPLRPLWPGTNPQSIKNWFPLADDLIQFLDTDHTSPIIGVGHSVGGTTTLMASLKRPDLFQALVLIDPVFMPPWFARGWHLIHGLGLGRRFHPLVSSAQRRRRSFESAETMFASYRRKSVFRHIDDSALKICIEAMTEPQHDGRVTLIYTSEWEVQIYMTGILHDLAIWKRLATLKMPVLILGAEHSNTFWPQTARRIQRYLNQAEIRIIPDSTHLLPLEKPGEVAQQIIGFLSE